MTTRRTVLPNARVQPRFGGLVTFGRYPRLADVSPENSPPDWIFYGVPYDGGVTYRPGADPARAIRDESQYLKAYHLEHAVDVPGTLSLADAGDAPVKPYSARENADRVTEWAVKLPEPRTAKLMALGGDHSIAYANIRATWERRGKPKKGLALIHFDSHLDTVDAVWGEKWGHASVFIRAIEEGLIDPRRMISIGVKGPFNTADDLDFARNSGVTLVTYDRWHREGPAPISRFLKSLKKAETYITFDIDAVDPAYAPGTGTPSVGGFTSADALALLRSLKGVNVVGADVVEVLPDRDHAGITALLAAHIAFEIVALDAV